MKLRFMETGPFMETAKTLDRHTVFHLVGRGAQRDVETEWRVICTAAFSSPVWAVPDANGVGAMTLATLVLELDLLVGSTICQHEEIAKAVNDAIADIRKQLTDAGFAVQSGRLEP